MRLFGALVAVVLSGPVAFVACSAVEQPKIGSFDTSKDLVRPNFPGSVSGGCGTIVTPDPSCAVKFSTDIYPMLTSGSPWNCAASGCHGSTTAQPLPYGFGIGVNPTPAIAYSTMAATTSFAKPIINPCSTVPGDSYLYCNIGGTAGGTTQCGPAMPQGARDKPTDPPPTGSDKLETWLKCGSPNN